MKSITFSQALLAVGLIGLTLPLTVGQSGLSYIGAAYAVEGGPSPVGPIVALAATLAVAIAILVAGVVRIRAERSAEAPLTYPQLLVTIGLLGLLVAGALSPISVVFSIVTGWDQGSWWTSTDAGPLALQAGAFAIPLLVIGSNLKGALRGPSTESEGITRPFTCLVVLTLVFAGATAPVGVIRPLLHSLFSGRYTLEYLDGPLVVGVDVGMAPELVSLVLVALAIPLAVLLFLRWKEEALANAAYAGPLVITAALLVGSTGVLGAWLLLFFAIPIAALLWPLLRGPGPAKPPGRLTNGQLLAWVGLICLAVTTTQTYGFASLFAISGPVGH
ncbi:MAG: hypothetical protein F4X03_08340 [Dehalococcoidia bacterium]|nr:hypothetical protein [Dehalococcoidia bacterium]MYD28902.1 hypothetical protein [Dehalococcoidia bacterium]